MRKAMEIDTGDDPIKTVDLLCDRYILNRQENASILMHFMKGGDLSHFGLVNAVTRASQDVKDYNRATELERIGGVLLEEGIEKAVPKAKILMLPKAA